MKPPGFAIYHGESQPLESSGGLEPGTAVGFDSNGQVAPVLKDSDQATPNVETCVGVVADTVDPNHAAGELISVYTGGTIVTSVVSGVTERGVEASGTAGALTNGSGAGTAFSAAGGEYQGSIPAGHAAIRFGGVQ